MRTASNRPAELDIDANCSIERIAKELGVSRQRVTAILQSALRKIRQQLALKGINRPSDVTPD